MRRYATIGGIVVAAMMMSSTAAFAQPVDGDQAGQPQCPPAAAAPPGPSTESVPGAMAGAMTVQGLGSASRARSELHDPDGSSQDEDPDEEPADEDPAEEPADDEPTQDEPAPPAADDCAPADRTQGPAGQETSAAATFGWGEPNREDEFDEGLGEDWSVYDGPGHGGEGRRTPDAVSVQDGIMTITGDSEGNTAGMAWNPGQKYGRWEGRVKAPAADPSYNALLLLWPDAEDFPVGGEVDFMEMLDPSRQKTNLFLHYGENNDQVDGEVEVDGTEWHNWAVEWAPTHIAAFVDGKEWWRTTDVDILPPREMHLCIQLDWFPEGGDVQESNMQVDWVKQYSLDAEDAEDAVDGAGEDVGQAVEDAAEAADAAGDAARDAAQEGVEDGVRNGAEAGKGLLDDVTGVDDVTGPLTEGMPDLVQPARGLVDRAVSVRGG